VGSWDVDGGKVQGVSAVADGGRVIETLAPSVVEEPVRERVLDVVERVLELALLHHHLVHGHKQRRLR
jgi:hypothetical protein